MPKPSSSITRCAQWRTELILARSAGNLIVTVRGSMSRLTRSGSGKGPGASCDEESYVGVGEVPEPTVGVRVAAEVRDRGHDHGVQVSPLLDAGEKGVGLGVVIQNHLGETKLPPQTEVAEDPGQRPPTR
ncbi:hypothetical protein ACFVXG_22970 [Kitasatospora sp. NPDC058162]|uniref:hypothetical protein n=1 Tax=Kitasatospora sp. NPDC058162 TaxID=3346362 RepID=UPI0036D7B3F0